MIAEEDVERRCHQMQVFRARQVDQECKHDQKVYPPEEAEGSDVRIGAKAAKGRANPASDGCPGGSVAGRILEALDYRQCKDHQKDQSQDDVAIPGAMQEAA